MPYREGKQNDLISMGSYATDYPTTGIYRQNITDCVLEGPKIDAGSGDDRMRFSEEKGLWIGSTEFDDAPFSVDMQGNISAVGIELTWDNLDNIPDRFTDEPATGLNLTPDYLGYYDGNEFTAYIDNQGQFYFGGNSDNYIEWDGSNLLVRGELNADDINTGTLTGRTIQTNDEGNNRVAMIGETDTLEWVTSYNNTSTEMHQDSWLQGTSFSVSHWDNAFIKMGAGTSQFFINLELDAPGLKNVFSLYEGGAILYGIEGSVFQIGDFNEDMDIYHYGEIQTDEIIADFIDVNIIEMDTVRAIDDDILFQDDVIISGDFMATGLVAGQNFILDGNLVQVDGDGYLYI